MAVELLRLFDTKAQFDTCDLTQVETDSVPGKVVLDSHFVGGVDETLDATANNWDLATDDGTGVPTLVTGHFGTNAIRIIDDNNMQYSNTALSPTNPFSVEIYVYAYQNPDADQYIVNWYDSIGAVADCIIIMKADGTIFFRVKNTAGTLQSFTTGAMPLNQWNKLAITVSSGASQDVKFHWNIGAGLVELQDAPLFGGTFPYNDLNIGNSYTSPTCDIAVDEIRISDSERSPGEMADPGASGYTPDGNTVALYHCEEVNVGGVDTYYSSGTIKTPELTSNGFLYPSQVEKVVSSLPVNTAVKIRWRAGEFVFGSWSTYDPADTVDFSEVILYRKFQIEIELSTSDTLVTPTLDLFQLFGEETDGSELFIASLNSVVESLDEIITSLGYSTKARLYDNRLTPYWETEAETWILQRYEASVLPISDGWQVVSVGDSSESIVAGVFNTNTTSGSWGKNNIGMVSGQQFQMRFKKASDGATERRGIECEYDSATKRFNLYFWNDYVSFNSAKINGYAIDTTTWHTYQVLLAGTGLNDLELRIDGDTTLRATATHSSPSAGGISNGWEYPDNSFASAPHVNLELDWIRSGIYEPWHEATYTLENANVKDLYAYFDVVFDTAQDISLAYLGKMLNVLEWSIQYWDGAIWKDWFVEYTVGDEFNRDFWWESKDFQVSAEKLRFLIHNRIDTGTTAKLGEIYVGNILYQAPDTPQNLEDNDDGAQGNIELGGGKNITWQEYETYKGRLLFNLFNDRHQVKLKEYHQGRIFMVLLEPVDRIDRFYKVNWQGKWKSKYSTGYREVGWDITMELIQTV